MLLITASKYITQNWLRVEDVNTILGIVRACWQNLGIPLIKRIIKVIKRQARTIRT